MTSTSYPPSAIPEKLSKRASGFSIVFSVLLIVCGALAILLPFGMSIGVVILVSWLLIMGGIVQFVHVFRCQGIGDGIWKALIAIIYFVTGLYLRFNLRVRQAALTLVLIAFFVAQGLVDIFVYSRTRQSGISRYLLFNGLITPLLGVMLWRRWPSSAIWVFGLLVGINMIMTGITRLMLSLGIRLAIRLRVPVVLSGLVIVGHRCEYRGHRSRLPNSAKYPLRRLSTL